MADSVQLIAATGDPDLKSRMTALLASTGASTAAGLIEVHMGALVAVPIAAAGVTIINRVVIPHQQRQR